MRGAWRPHLIWDQESPRSTRGRPTRKYTKEDWPSPVRQPSRKRWSARERRAGSNPASSASPCGPTDTTPASEAGNAGSTPAGGTMIRAWPTSRRSCCGLQSRWIPGSTPGWVSCSLPSPNARLAPSGRLSGKGPQERPEYTEPFHAELYDLSEPGSGRWTQIAYALTGGRLGRSPTPLRVHNGQTKRPSREREGLSAVSTRRAPEGIRTPDLLIRSQMLYPAELRALVQFSI